MNNKNIDIKNESINLNAELEFYFWDSETKALQKANQLFDWMDENNGKTPGAKHGLRDFLDKMRAYKKGKGKFPPSLQELANQKGYPKIWENIDLKQECLNMANKLCDFADSNNGIFPKQPHPLAKFLAQKRRDKLKKTIRGTFYPELQELAQKRGYPNMWDQKNNEQMQLEKTKNFFDYLDNNDRKIPSQKHAWGKFLHQIRDAKKTYDLKNQLKDLPKRRSAKFYPSLEKLAIERGYSGIWESKRYKLSGHN